MYGMFTYIYHTNQPNVGKYTHTWTLWVQEATKPTEQSPPLRSLLHLLHLLSYGPLLKSRISMEIPDEIMWLPREPKTFIFRGYNPYIGGVKPSNFMVLGSHGNL